MVTLTGTFTRLDGTPATGTVRVTPSRSPIMDSAGRVVISGPQVFPLDGDGKLTVQIPASDDPDLGPAFTYAIDVNLTHASWKISKVWIPHGSTTVDLSEIGDYQPVPGVATRVVTIPADGADGQVLVWDGAGFSWADPPKGDKGDDGDPGTSDITVDTSVGTRVFANGIMVYGDTGWRRIPITSVQIPGLIEMFIRRTTHHVHAAMYANTTVTPGEVEVIAVLPPGFRPHTNHTRGRVPFDLMNAYDHDAARPSHTVTLRENGEIRLRMEGTARLHATLTTWAQTEWPTTQPGTP